jgi:hypothetical protein
MQGAVALQRLSGTVRTVQMPLMPKSVFYRRVGIFVFTMLCGLPMTWQTFTYESAHNERSALPTAIGLALIGVFIASYFALTYKPPIE